MTSYLISEMKSIDGLRLYGTGGRKCPLLSFTVDGVHHSDVATLLDKMNIAVRSGLMCSEPLIGKFGRTGMVRVSLHSTTGWTNMNTSSSWASPCR